MHVVSRESLPSFHQEFSDSALEPEKKKRGKGDSLRGIPDRREKTEAHGGDDGG